ncbi:hypothetical protein [Caballeronia sp. dw_19]|uniref:hypothetical protein n=1 Tax=Caballeronia sp. dw_19 TaxID=2719791 RepID=UPI001BD59EA4|nr:hypothetical protein [Caballeronia sp. dw_19]
MKPLSFATVCGLFQRWNLTTAAVEKGLSQIRANRKNSVTLVLEGTRSGFIALRLEGKIRDPQISFAYVQGIQRALQRFTIGRCDWIHLQILSSDSQAGRSPPAIAVLDNQRSGCAVKRQVRKLGKPEI